MRTRSQPQSPGGLISLSDKPNKRVMKRARDQDDFEESPAKRVATATFLKIREKARATEEPQVTNQAQAHTALSDNPQQPTTPSSVGASSSYNFQPQTQAPATDSRSAGIFGNMFGSISRAASRVFTSYTPGRVQVRQDDQKSSALDDETPSQAPIARRNPFDYKEPDSPSTNASRFRPRSEPRPRRSMFQPPPSRKVFRYDNVATFPKPNAEIQKRMNDPKEEKRYMWKVGWEGIPLNRITDPISRKNREEEAKAAGIDLTEFDFYEEGHEPGQLAERPTTPEPEQEPENVPTTGQKRKRPPLSPGGSIPNPEGVSYGMDLRYFDDDYESSPSGDENNCDDDDDADVTARQPKSAMKKVTETSFERISRSSKRVKFDNSPIDTPSKERARARYTGVHFSDSPNAFVAAEEEAAARATTEFTPSRAHPAPNRFVIPDDWSDESTNRTQSSSGMSGIEYEGDESLQRIDDTTIQPDAESSTFNIRNDTSEPATPKRRASTSISAATTTPTTGSNISPLSKARQSAEKYKPKSPSNLRQASRLSSSSLTTSSMNAAAEEDEEEEDEEEESNEFSALAWPKPPSMVDAGICTEEIAALVESLWSPAEEARAEEWFEREFGRFRAATAAAVAA